MQNKTFTNGPTDHFELGTSIENFFRWKRFLPKERETQTAILNNIAGHIFLQKEHITMEHEIIFHMLQEFRTRFYQTSSRPL